MRKFLVRGFCLSLLLSFISAVSPSLAAEEKVISVGAGDGFSCALTASGNVECWGKNNYGQTDVPTNLEKITQLSVGADHACALALTGLLHCWGANYDEQAAVPEGLGKLKQVSAGGSNTCVLTDLGEVSCWGANYSHQNDIPYGLSDVQKISTGGSIACALKTNQSLVCWGWDRTVPGDLGLVSDVSADSTYTCAKSTTGVLRCWGWSNFGQLGYPSDLGLIDSISAGPYNACAVKPSGSVICWGSNMNLQNNVPSDIGSVSQISVGVTHTCVVSVSGTVTCWGMNNYDQLNVPYFWPPENPQDPLAQETKVLDVSTGYEHSCAISDTGLLRCWGDNTYGQINVPELLGPVTQVSSGANVTCAIARKGKLVCWGGDYYALNVIPSNVGPVRAVSVGSGYVCAIEITNQLRCWGGDWRWAAGAPTGFEMAESVSVGSGHLCIVSLAHQAKCWGSNWSGQASVPSDLGLVSQVVASTDWSCALNLLGKVRCWGEEVSWAKDINSLPRATSLASGGTGYSASDYLCVRSISGQLECLGSLTPNGDPIPTEIGTIKAVAIGGKSACAISVAGALACWGSNEKGQVDIPASLRFAVISHSLPTVFGCRNTQCPEGSSLIVAQFGDELTVDAGSWQPDATLDYQWFLDDEVIPGATSQTYVPKLSDINHRLTVQVHGSAPAVLDVTQTSSSIAIIENHLLASALPVIKNIDGFELSTAPAVGSTITVDPGAWAVPVIFSYQWLRDNQNISGATSQKYQVTGLDWGHQLKVRVTGSKQGYESDSIYSYPVSVGEKGSIAFGSMTKQISVSRTYACAIDSTDLLNCWGDDKNGILNVPSDLGTVKQVSVNDRFVCSIKTDDSLRCWGFNYYGEISIPNNLGKVIQVSAGFDYVCAIRTDRIVRCWGRDSASALNVPTDLGQVSQISTGSAHACAITLPGGVRCWGAAGTTGVPASLISAVQISAGYYITCAVDKQAKVTCWGSSYEDSSQCDYYVEFESGYQLNSCAYYSPYTAVCQVIRGVRTCVENKIPEDLEPVTMVSVGGLSSGRTCVVLVSGGIRCWGRSQDRNTSPDPEYGKTLALAQDLNAIVTLTESGRLTCESCMWFLIPPERLTLPYIKLTPPTITGISKNGSRLEVTTTEANPDITYSYSWERDGELISGASQRSYLLTAADVGHKIFARVVASSPGYSSTAIKVQGQIVLPGELGVLPTPQLIGDKKLDSLLTVSTGDWPQDLVLEYQWLRDGLEIYSENNSTYRIRLNDVGHNISVRVTGQKNGYSSVQATSTVLRPISNQPTTPPKPFITGSTSVGSTMTVNPGIWGEGYFFSYQWFRNGQQIPGAVNKFYVSTLFDKGSQLSVQVSGKLPNTSPISYDSSSVLISGSRLQASLVGKFQVGSRVWASASGRTGKFQYSYQWFRNGDLIEGQNSRSLSLSARDVYQNISVRICATVGYTPIDCAEAISNGQVVAAKLASIPLSISNSDPGVLTAKVGRALPEGNVYYEWFRDGAIISGATQNAYTLRPEDRGHNIRVKLLVFAHGYQPIEALSPQRRVK
ncbi:MAG: hypothetical protein EBZ61_03435 [Micrococcales bacterium]|nr:hypothetical protein [Micrococcales bacterium]